MKKGALSLALLALVPLSAHAYRIDRMMNCDLSVRDFFAPLVQERAIQIPADRINPAGINYFHKARNDSLTFYGMTVGDVYGYTDDPLLFQHPASTHPEDGYGIFVQAPIAEVQATLASIGNSRAQVRRMATNATAIFCLIPPPAPAPSPAPQ